MEKEDTAKFIKSDGISLSKKTFKWDVPTDLERLSNKYDKPSIGIGMWSGTTQKFICMAPRKLTRRVFYIEKELLKEINKAFVKGRFE